MISIRYSPFRAYVFSIIVLVMLFFYGCKKDGTAHGAFYSWKTVFHPNKTEAKLLQSVGNNHLYLRFFDVIWNSGQQRALPNGVLVVKSPLKGLHITPVIYITNQSLAQSKLSQMDSLAFKVNHLVSRLSAQQGISYQSIQIDCDWTVATRIRYFAFLRALKYHSGKKLEATIRLHQVKYPERTGIPPVHKGLLMFYNMGKISAGLTGRNSIYNYEDAAAYLTRLPNYNLPLDVALPLFSWAIHIRHTKIMQLYAKITLLDLANQQHFVLVRNGTNSLVYTASTSFYLKGIYIKKDDAFKFETVNKNSLREAAQQLAENLKPLENRNVIYFELSSLQQVPVQEKDLQDITLLF